MPIGSPVKISGEVVQVSGQHVYVESGAVVQVSGQVVMISGQHVYLESGATIIVEISGLIVDISGGHVYLESGAVVLISGQTVELESGTGPISVELLSGAVVLVSGQVVQVSGQHIYQESGAVVLVSGQTVITTSGLGFYTPTEVKTGSLRIVSAASGGVVLHSGAVLTAVVKAVTLSGDIYLGGATNRPYSGFGLVLQDAEAVNLDIDDFSRIYVVATVSGDQVSFAGVV